MARYLVEESHLLLVSTLFVFSMMGCSYIKNATRSADSPPEEKTEVSVRGGSSLPQSVSEKQDTVRAGPTYPEEKRRDEKLKAKWLPIILASALILFVVILFTKRG